MLTRTVLGALAAACSVVAQSPITVYQAEQAKLSGVTVGSSVAGYSGLEFFKISQRMPRLIFVGTGYVEGFDEASDSITFTVNSSYSELYDLKLIWYLAPALKRMGIC